MHSAFSMTNNVTIFLQKEQKTLAAEINQIAREFL
jgi:hypothetical protein